MTWSPNWCPWYIDAIFLIWNWAKPGFKSFITRLSFVFLWKISEKYLTLRIFTQYFTRLKTNQQFLNRNRNNRKPTDFPYLFDVSRYTLKFCDLIISLVTGKTWILKIAVRLLITKVAMEVMSIEPQS